MQRDPLIRAGVVDENRAMGLVMVQEENILWLQKEGASGGFILNSSGNQNKHFKKIMQMGV